jgi:hypothetical protein
MNRLHGRSMNVFGNLLIVCALITAALAAEPVLARGKGSSGGGHAGGARSGTHSGGHHHHGRTNVFIGGAFAGPVLWPLSGYAGYPVVAVYPHEPLHYIEQSDETAHSGEWLYCEAAQNYFPYVPECPGGWQRIAPPLPSG